MAMLPDDPNASIMEIIRRRKSLSPFMQGLTGNTNAPPTPGWDPSISGVVNTLKSMVPEAMIPPGVVSPQDNYPDPRVEAYRSQSQRGAPIDPAAAGAQGFRIPDYIPAAQTQGGSGTYMSKVPMDAPQMTRGGIGSDYVAGGSQSPDVAAEDATPAQDDGLFSFFGKPQATDAMTAFGAAMLKGKNFAEGLANASTAVNDVATKYRPYSDPEVQRMMQEASIKSQINRKLNPAAMQKGDIWYSPDNRAYREIFNPNSPNGSSFLDISSGQTVSSLPPGSTQRVDSAIGERNAAAANFETEARDAADKAFSDIGTYNQMLELLPTSGAGPDAISAAKRSFVQTTGVSLDGVDLNDMQQVNKLSRDLELSLAQTQRGLGQFTEMERKIVREALPSLETNAPAFRRMVEMLKNRAERAQRLYEEWLTLPPDVKNSQYNGSFENFSYFWKKQNQGSKAAQPEAQGSQSGNRPSLDDIFK